MSEGWEYYKDRVCHILAGRPVRDLGEAEAAVDAELSALRARAEKAEAALKESLMREAAGADCRVALRLRAEKAEARSVELEAGLSTCIGWIATMGVGPRINAVLQEAREALAGKGE